MRSTILVLTLAACLTGCSFFDLYGGPVRNARSSSLVEYLYPDGQVPEPAVGIPTLKIPARVGLAFVPRSPRTSHYAPLLSAAEQAILLEQVRDHFASRDFVGAIEIIPETTLRAVRGFDNLAQVGRLHNVDLMALVSYDVLTRTTDNPGSLLYLTVVGSFVVPGNRNETTSFVDTTVFDLHSRRLLFRAAGADTRSNLTTAVNVVANRQREVGRSFEVAMNAMTENLDQSLERFRDDVQTRQTARLVNHQGGAAGSLHPIVVVLMAGLLIGWRRWDG